MAETKLKVEKIDGRPFTIYVADDGSFFADDGQGDRITATNLKHLIERLRKGLRTHGRVKIPATHVEEGWRDDKLEIEDIELIGIHGGNGNVLYQVVGKKGTPEQFRYSTECYRRLTAEEKAELRRLKKAVKDAVKAFDRYKEERRINAKEAIETAQASVLGESA